jgi:hypothetical protein
MRAYHIGFSVWGMNCILRYNADVLVSIPTRGINVCMRLIYVLSCM